MHPKQYMLDFYQTIEGRRRYRILLQKPKEDVGYFFFLPSTLNNVKLLQDE